MRFEGDDNNTLNNVNGASKGIASNIQCASEGDDKNEEKDDPLNEHRQATSETCLQSVLPDYPVTIETNSQSSLGDEIYSIAPGENKHPY